MLQLRKTKNAVQTFCATCGSETLHRHLHTATSPDHTGHVSGSERWTCEQCGKSTFARDRSPNPNPDFVFVLDADRRCQE